MSMPDRENVLDSITRGERVLAQARSADSDLIVTERRLAVASERRALLDVELGGLRRIQFDIERDRDATLVVVPHDPRLEPQMLTVAADEYERIAEGLVVVGRRLAALTGARSTAAHDAVHDDGAAAPGA